MRITRLLVAVTLALALAGAAFAAPAGTDQPDVLVGTRGADWIRGGGGGDAIYSLAGDDVVFGDEGRDQLWGGRGEDVLYGGPGQDTLVGRWDDDRLYTRDGTRDFVHCGHGRDVVIADARDLIDVTCDVVRLPQ